MGKGYWNTLISSLLIKILYHIINKNSSSYEGEFKKGFRHGFGKMNYHSGNYYVGEWKLDKKDGQGTMYWENTENEDMPEKV